MRQPNDDEYTLTSVRKGVIKGFGSKEPVKGVQGSVTKCVSNIWIHLNIWIYYPIFEYIRRYLENSDNVAKEVSLLGVKTT